MQGFFVKTSVLRLKRMILAAKSAACWCFLAALWYFKVAEIVLNPLVGMGVPS